ncbi:MAG TPA: hypothetical protein PKD52_01945 [Clostridiales bacterium]|nr:hypothetical protein [Clostridiales bacterium]
MWCGIAAYMGFLRMINARMLPWSWERQSVVSTLYNLVFFRKNKYNLIIEKELRFESE